MNSMEAFEALNQSPLSPPGRLFPVVWTVLYVLMGIASHLVSASDAPREEKARALWTYGIQLAFNFLWPIAFFNLKWYLSAFLWLVILWILILRMYCSRSVMYGASSRLGRIRSTWGSARFKMGCQSTCPGSALRSGGRYPRKRRLPPLWPAQASAQVPRLPGGRGSAW